MAEKDVIKEYRKKRDFNLSSEPFGGSKHKKDKDKQIFVIQKHDASNLHYDFRLLIDGVLKSWAVPKGPSTDPQKKRLAVRTEDHPMEYADFEGTIPKDQYGGGIVMVWDSGTYATDKKDKEGNQVSMLQQLKNGHCTFSLKGHKLNGGFVLLRMKKKNEKNENWLLKKVDDDEADARRKPTKTENKSVLTGRTLKQIEKEED